MSTKNWGKIRGTFSILITSQIVNLKTIRDVLVLRQCYQCGGETLGPVVKHSVCDSTVDSVLTHTSPWTSKIMGFHRVWVPKEVNIGCLRQAGDFLYGCKYYIRLFTNEISDMSWFQ